jgi:ubiquitin-small subunit ribosomal protein S27Ae
MPKKRKSKEKKGKKAHKNKITGKKYLKYTGDKKGKNCPRCGPGIFMAINTDRMHCGRCHYSEFEKKN